jgi:hypothetical protein
VAGGVLFHFSEDPGIERFVPHVPASNPTHQPAVWAIDEDHAPIYWFPRDCPRVTVWPWDDTGLAHLQAAFETTAHRLHVIETRWLERMHTVALFRYDLPDDTFEPWVDARGQYISRVDVVPVSVQPVGDLVTLHERSGIELRAAASLRQVRERAMSDEWNFSIVRWMNAV